MATTIHLPKALLEKIDGRAKTLGVSRNRFISEALAEKVDSPTEWPEAFVRELKKPVPKGTSAAAQEMQRIILSGRRSRRAPPEF